MTSIRPATDDDMAAVADLLAIRPCGTHGHARDARGSTDERPSLKWSGAVRFQRNVLGRIIGLRNCAVLSAPCSDEAA